MTSFRSLVVSARGSDAKGGEGSECVRFSFGFVSGVEFLEELGVPVSVIDEEGTGLTNFSQACLFCKS